MRSRVIPQYRQKPPYLPHSIRLGAGVLCIFYGVFLLLATLCLAGGTPHAPHAHEAQSHRHHTGEAAPQADPHQRGPAPVSTFLDICGCTLRGLTSTVLSAPVDLLVLAVPQDALLWHSMGNVPRAPYSASLSIRAPPVVYPDIAS